METLYAWDVENAGGVTNDQVVALGHVYSALVRAPLGAYGVVRMVTLSYSGRIAYVELGVVGEAWRTGSGVEWTR